MRWPWLVAGLLCLVGMHIPEATALTITSGEIQAAQQLSPAQQQGIANKLGIQLPSQSGSSANTGTSASSPSTSSTESTGTESESGTSAPAPSQTIVTPTPASTADTDIEKQFNTRITSPIAQLTSSTDAVLRSTWDRQVGTAHRHINQRLKQFGYDLFRGSPSTFAPVTDIPIPPQYVLGPGDQIRIQYFGSRNDSLTLVIDRDGLVSLPDVGPIALAGLTFQDAKALLAENIREKLTGVTASITMGQLRSIRVFVLGDASHPGSYLVSGVSTISNALFAAGGVSRHGSLRHILLKRNGKVIRDLDLYDFLLHGNSKHDMRLLPGDVIFIPPIGKTVAVAGQVVRPGIYELRDEHHLSDLLALAGGTLADADTAHMQVERLSPDGDRTLLDMNSQQSRGMPIHNGDMVLVYAVPGLQNGVVTLSGMVKRPGEYGMKPDMRISDLLHSRDDLLPDAFMQYALIQRTNPADQSLSVLRVSLDDLLVRHDIKADVRLQNRDKIYVFSRAELQPMSTVQAYGELYQPGAYPLTKGMRVLDLVLAAGGPTNAAYLGEAEITRYSVADGKKLVSRHFQVNLRKVLAGDAKANIPLQSSDQLIVRRLSEWHKTAQVTLSGQIQFPGSYPIKEGEHLSSVLERAGGFTDKAYLRGAVFTRVSIRKEQQQQISDMATRVQAEIAQQEAAITNITQPGLLAKRQAGLEAAKRVLTQMQQVKATGRLVIHLEDIRQLKGSQFDLTLRNGDTLYVPQRPDEVMVMGQVYNSTAMLYQKKLDRSDYIDRAGGTTEMADTSHIYIVRADGMVDSNNGFLSKPIEPGDVIVVPEKLQVFNALSSALDWSKVLYQVGYAAAAMKVIGIL